MGHEVELIADGEGLAVIGEPADVERFLASEALTSKELGVSRLRSAFSGGAAVVQAGSDIAASSGRWVKLTEESAQVVKKYGLMETKTPGVSHAMVGQPGEIKQWIQIVKTPGSLVSNPAMLAGAAGIMSQIAMQQTMAEITDYLARIDEKLDDLMRTQMNQVLARMDGVQLGIQEATTVRDTVGRVSDVTWSKVQSSSVSIMETQGLALRQLKDLAEKLERETTIGDLAKTSKEAEAEVEKWLAVLARCFHLQDAIAVLELDRVLDTSPDELDRHRLGLAAARQERLELIAQSADFLLSRMNAAVGMANSKVLLHPTRSPAVVESRNNVADDVHDFQVTLGLESGHESSEGRRWADAAAERLDKVRDTGASGIDTVKQFGGDAQGKARSALGKISGFRGDRKLRKSDGGQSGEE